MAASKTSLSAGEVIREVLLTDETVSGITTKIFPVATTEAKLPYILYRRAGMEHNPTKAGLPGADSVQIELVCYAKTYAGSIELAEAVRKALDYKQATVGSLNMRSCTLTDSEEGYEDDAFAQSLIFNVKI